MVASAHSAASGPDDKDGDDADPDTEFVTALRDFVAEHVGQIEVMWEGRLERLYYPLTRQCRSLAISSSWREAVVKELEWAAPETRCAHWYNSLK